ncbi:iron complex outermembrane recepter protein [Sphingomonas sp. NFR04]|uniref:TonB-dependent receptor n=1 Tax=Sphingomonas sp. NFR04 TaxID=1566283 RepID=UPI0008E9427A|nr:TonB-dependent receptor [Sphingomonas sp. NFR04]SFK42606.1 iron complex outermembrane recepter protein [Sphingomonas sp. NFR04]
MRTALLAGAAIVAFVPHAFADPDPQQANDKNIIVVTATPYAVASDEVPTIVTHVDRDQILRSGGASISDALAQEPGIAATGFASGASRPIIRGMDATRVRILENGASSSDVSDIGPDHGIPVDPFAAESIEVVRGAGTLRYGSQAIGGVVNVINNRVPMKLPSDPISGEAVGSYGSAAKVGEGGALVDARLGQFALHADGFYHDASDYDTPLGVQQNSFFRGHGASVGGSYFFGGDDASHVGLSVSQYNSKYGIPSDTTYIDMRQTKVMSRDVFAVNAGPLKSINLDASYADYTHDEKEPDGTIDTTFHNKEFDGHLEFLLNPLGLIRNSAIGFEVQNRKFSAIGDDSSYLFPTTTQSEAAYLFTEVPVADILHLQASGRVEHVRNEGTPAGDVFTVREFTPVSGAIGALLDVGSHVKLGFTGSSTGRAPAITELFARGGHDGPNTFETGDPNLKIERANSIEATLRVNVDRFHFDGSAYSTWFKNYIYGDLTGRTCDDDGTCALGGDGDLKELNYRQQGAHFRGLEGKASLDLFHQHDQTLQLTGLADYTRATLDDGGNVPRIPPYRLGAGMNLFTPQFDGAVQFVHNAKQTKFGAFDTETPGYNMINANIAWRPFKSQPGIEFAIVGQNLTDEIARNATSLNKDLVIQPGRNIRFMVKIATF